MPHAPKRRRRPRKGAHHRKREPRLAQARRRVEDDVAAGHALQNEIAARILLDKRGME